MSAAIPRVEPRPERTKRCAHCGNPLPIKVFHRHAQSPDGRRPECKFCRNDRKAVLREGAPRARPWGLLRPFLEGTLNEQLDRLEIAIARARRSLEAAYRIVGLDPPL